MKADRRRVVGHSSLPVRLPLWPGLVLWLFLDRLQANGIAWGIVGTLWGLWFLMALTEWLKTDEHDLPGYGDRT